MCVWDGVVQPSPTYEPRHPSQAVMFQVVRDHFETFRSPGRRCRTTRAASERLRWCSLNGALARHALTSASTTRPARVRLLSPQAMLPRFDKFTAA